VNGIWGAVDFSGSEPDRIWLSNASSYLTGSSCLSSPSCVLGALGNSPFATANCAVSKSALAPFCITLQGQINNRPELIEALRPVGDVPDGELILSAYEKWGIECARFLAGDYAFAIWDDRRRQLFCCRDHLGIRPLFYWLEGTRLLFASDPLVILKNPIVKRTLNRRKLADLACFQNHRLHREETFHAGIRCFASGSSSIFDGSGVRHLTYWEPEIRRDVVPRREEEIFEALRELLFQCVRNRIKGKRSVAAHLSGGLDSSSLVSIAARVLAESNQSLHALSGVAQDRPGKPLKDEREYIDEFRSWPNVRIDYITAPGRGPFDPIDDPDYFEATFTKSSAFFLQDAFDASAHSSGADIVLEGIGGELGPTSWGKEHHLELAARLRWITLRREMKDFRKVNQISPVRFLGGQLRNFLSPHRNMGPFVLFTPSFQRESESAAGFRWRLPDHDRAQIEALRLWLRKPMSGRAWTADGIPFSRPFLDKRLLEFCLALPGRLKTRNGYRRYLIRRALDGVLPPKIQWRTDKKPFSPDYHIRYNAQLGKARDFLASIRTSDPVRSLVDVGRLSAMVKPVESAAGSWEALMTVPYSIYLICFLRQFPEFRA
jgi:asparagine synthase (glutamine-hydrolysing)